MKVRDVIEALQDLDPDRELTTVGPLIYAVWNVANIAEREDGKVVIIFEYYPDHPPKMA